MTESLKPEWRVLTTEEGRLLYHNDKTGEETYESPYLAQLNKYKNCDLAIWQEIDFFANNVGRKDRREECVRFASGTLFCPGIVLSSSSSSSTSEFGY